MNNIYDLLLNQKETTLVTYIVTENKDGTVNVVIGGGSKRSVTFKNKHPEDSKLINDIVNILLDLKNYENYLRKNLKK